MNRAPLMRAVNTTGGWVLDPHSAKFQALRTKSFTTTAYVVKDSEAGRPDLIAHKVYGDVSYWWVLAFYNGIIDPLTEFYTGRVLTVPDYGEVSTLLASPEYQSKPGSFVSV